jgi:hypothetical protein
VIGAELLLLLEFEGDEDIAGGRPDLEDQAAVASDGPEEVASVDERDTSPGVSSLSGTDSSDSSDAASVA